jgi:hypothetical protein
MSFMVAEMTIPAGVQLTPAGARQIRALIQRQMEDGAGQFETRPMATGEVVVLAAGLPWIWDPTKKRVKRVPPSEVDLAMMAFSSRPAWVPITVTDSYGTALRLAED